jgi:hypothetical protein
LLAKYPGGPAGTVRLPLPWPGPVGRWVASRVSV